MLAPLPEDPVLTAERLIVREDVPLFLDFCRFFNAEFSTFSATLVGGGGAAGGGVGSGILGDDMHIVKSPYL